MVTASKEASGKGRWRPSPTRRLRALLACACWSMGRQKSAPMARLGVGAVASQGEEDVAAAGGEIEDARGLLRGHGADEPPAPVEVEPAAHDVVHEVVAGGDAAEHGGDGLGRLMGEVVPDGGVVGGARQGHGAGSFAQAGRDRQPKMGEGTNS